MNKRLAEFLKQVPGRMVALVEIASTSSVTSSDIKMWSRRLEDNSQNPVGNAGMTANVEEACGKLNGTSHKLKVFPISDECSLAIKLTIWCH